MAFRFALAPLLRLRQSLEHQCALTLQRAAFEVARTRETLAQLNRYLDESARVDAIALAGGRTAAELQFANLLGERLEQLRVQLREEIAQLEKLRQQAAFAFQQALREREALESLRDRQHRSYQQEQQRRQQQELDAAFLLQTWHRRNG
jgi:flagellar export protein FliJ